MVKCVTVMGVGHQLRLRTKMSDQGDLGEKDTFVGCFGVGLWLERVEGIFKWFERLVV